MTYKNYLLFLFIVLLFVSCKKNITPSQEIKHENNVTVTHLGHLSPKQLEVKKALDNYLKQLSTFNTDMIVEMTYPRLFYVIDLDLYRQYIASMMNSTDIKMNAYETNITKLSKVITFSNETEFAQAEYLSTNTIHFLNDAMYSQDESMNYLYDALIHKYGADSIHIDVKKRILTIKSIKKLLIIKEKETEWKFLGDNYKYRMLYPSFLPNEIYKIIEGGENNETI
ncbi:MAG TPA: hypothetical protein ENK82_07575 [Campylobacterales bacterium]|nr:hypothetical protein [Campylobacterales bacterium]HHS93190.1 hypothetical protein [Campylobacterales bacterium]